ncbi:hypothetical protein GCM10022223_00540 [Kineosporia mesophila]|uniref:Uncharacterized protein n=1 Tax=Kineosporia mesophila TaxID=566012 RepID=A0ABP6YVQ8_9ACTN
MVALPPDQTVDDRSTPVHCGGLTTTYPIALTPRTQTRTAGPDVWKRPAFGAPAVAVPLNRIGDRLGVHSKIAWPGIRNLGVPIRDSHGRNDDYPVASMISTAVISPACRCRRMRSQFLRRALGEGTCPPDGLQPRRRSQAATPDLNVRVCDVPPTGFEPVLKRF